MREPRQPASNLCIVFKTLYSFFVVRDARHYGAGISTFLAEMADAAAALRRATPRTLLIVDELGRGTSTADGYAIAYAVLRAVADVGARCLFATHYHQLVMDLGLPSYSSSPSDCLPAPPSSSSHGGRGGGGAVGTRVHVAHMMALARRPAPHGLAAAVAMGKQSAEAAEDIRFCYRLAPGPAPLGSCAMNVARIAGFPEHLLRRAAHVVENARLVPTKSKGGDAGRVTPPPPPPPRLNQRQQQGQGQGWRQLGEEALGCLRALVSDPLVGGVPGAVGDDAWAGGFYTLWLRCKQLERQP